MRAEWLKRGESSATWAGGVEAPRGCAESRCRARGGDTIESCPSRVGGVRR